MVNIWRSQATKLLKLVFRNQKRQFCFLLRYKHETDQWGHRGLAELNVGDFLRIVTDDVATSPGHETVLLRYTQVHTLLMLSLSLFLPLHTVCYDILHRTKLQWLRRTQNGQQYNLKRSIDRVWRKQKEKVWKTKEVLSDRLSEDLENIDNARGLWRECRFKPVPNITLLYTTCCVVQLWGN